MPRRIVYIGHSPTITTGQGAVSRRICGTLHRAGFDVVALGMGEERRRPPTLPYRLWVPCRHDTMGRGLLPQLMATEEPDLVFHIPWTSSDSTPGKTQTLGDLPRVWYVQSRRARQPRY